MLEVMDLMIGGTIKPSLPHESSQCSGAASTPAELSTVLMPIYGLATVKSSAQRQDKLKLAVKWLSQAAACGNELGT